ncbi:MAG: hypothetical protein HYT63_02855 [Candidatus Yanofskybacteria bacterium]|nr:hypothetical protein [Candidatus Yanofskybacteria bacterium]
MLKKVFLTGVTCIFSFVFWFKVNLWIDDPLRFRDINIWLWPAVILIIFVALLALSFLLLPRLYKLLAIFFNLAIFLIFFGVDQVILAGAGLALLIQLSAVSAVKSSGDNSLRFKFIPALKSGVSRVLTSVFILISFAYFLSPGVQASSKSQELPQGIKKTIQIVIGNYIGENLEIQNPRLKAETNNYVIKQITNFSKPYFKFLPPILAFGMFLILQGVSFVFIWLAILLAFIVFSIFKVSGLVRIEKKPKEAEVLVFNL